MRVLSLSRSRLVASVTAPAAVLLVGATLAATSASPSDDLCTISGRNVDGTASRDVMCGTRDSDTLNGNAGDDDLRGFGGADILRGGDGRDHLFGGVGGDFLQGGAGGDRNVAEGGNDRVSTRDGVIDSVLCGPGDDVADIDLADAANIAFDAAIGFESGCERVNVGAVREGPNVTLSGRSLRIRSTGRAATRVRCPASLRQPSRCAGALTLHLATRASVRRRAPATRYSLRPGQARTVPVRLSRLDRRALLRRGRARGQLTSVERGEFGKKTTIETVALRAVR